MSDRPPSINMFPFAQIPPLITYTRADLQAHALTKRVQLATMIVRRIEYALLESAAAKATSFSITTADIREKYTHMLAEGFITNIEDQDFVDAFKTMCPDSTITLKDGTITVDWSPL